MNRRQGFWSPYITLHGVLNESYPPPRVFFLVFLVAVSVVLLAGCAINTLMDAARFGDVDQVRHMIKAGANPNDAIEVPQGGRFTPLCALSLELCLSHSKMGTEKRYEKIYNVYSEIADILIANGANVNAYCNEFIPGSPLHIAVQLGEFQFAKFLIRKGANVNLAISGSTPTIFGVAGNGGDITPLMLASKRGDLEMVKLLVTSGANTSLKDSSGKTAKDHYADYLEGKREAERQEQYRLERARQDKAESREMWKGIATLGVGIAVGNATRNLAPDQQERMMRSSMKGVQSGDMSEFNLFG